MGCFSFLCKHCGEPIICDEHRDTGEKIVDDVTLYLLENGKVIEQMEGPYDSYGRVDNENGETVYWKKDWSEIVDMMFDANPGNGIAAVHERCKEKYNQIPTTKSDDDPGQGWVVYDDDIDYYV